MFDRITVPLDLSSFTELTHRPPLVERAELVAELTEHFRSPEGRLYRVRVWGGPRSDTTWAGWLEFTALPSRMDSQVGPAPWWPTMVPFSESVASGATKAHLCS